MCSVSIVRTPLIIGIGTVCFGLGALTVKLAEWQGIDVGERSGSADGSGRRSAPRALGATAAGSERAPSKEERGSGALPTTAQLIEGLDLWDTYEAMKQLEPMLRNLDSDQLQELLLQIDREAVDPARVRATIQVAGYFGRTHPQAALAFATDPKTSHLGGNALYMALVTLVRESPEDALSAVRSVHDPFERRGAMRQLMISMSNIAPATLYSWTEREEFQEFQSSFSMRNLMEGMAVESPTEAAALLGKINRGERRENGIRGLAAVWVQSDPTAALAWANSLEGREHSIAIDRMIGHLAVRDREAALALLDSSEGKERTKLLQPIARAMAKSDPGEALEWAATLDDPEDLKEALQSISGKVDSKEDVEKLLGIIGSLPEKQREGASRQFLGTWVRRDHDGATAWVEAIEDPEQKKLYAKSMIHGLERGDPKAAVEMIAHFGSSLDEPDWQIGEAFRKFALVDLDSAREAAEGLEEGPVKSLAMSSMVNAWAKHEPQAAAEFVLENFEPGMDQREMLEQVSVGWLHQDPEAALAWAGTLDGASRVAASDQLIVKLATNGELHLAQTALSDLLEAHPEEAMKSGRLKNAISGVLSVAGREDPQAGIAIINQLSTEQAQAESIGHLMGFWAGAEPEDAKHWLDQLEPGAVRDRAAQSLISNGGGLDRAVVFDTAVSITDEKMRATSLSRAVAEWSARDVDAARAGIEAADLSDHERQVLLEQIE